MCPKDKQNGWKNTSAGGFTLIEVLLALAIFAIGILALGTLQVRYITGNTLARVQTEALTRATDVLERLKELPAGHSELSSGSHGPFDDGVYEVTWDVTDDGPTANVKSVRVRVYPKGHIGDAISFRYFIAEEKK